ncbi:MAG: VWA domain-containing protein [Flammeovirgaceae bacterium]|nr:MAG: VWA domain-containing protein [Flammeovirgaceae bacterium]
MSWYREFGLTEIIFIAAFSVLYLLYILRVIRIARAIGSPFGIIFLKFILRSLIFALLIAALLGPSFGEDKREVKSVGKDIMICVDLSKSMDGLDIAPTRLEKVKNELKKVVQAFNSNRMGIIIFSSEAFMQCPLTYDQTALYLFIEAMNTALVPSGGTDFGPPLRMAMDKLEKDNTRASEVTSKVILLISDGEDFGDETDAALADIEKKGYKLFTLGVGTKQGGQIRTGTGFKTDRSGNTVVTRLNPDALKTLAGKTGGQYFEINENRNDIARLINTIDRIEGELMDARFIDITANKYFYFLALAVILLAVDVLVPVKAIRI